VAAAGQRAPVRGQRLQHRALRIDVQRRAELARERVEVAAVELQRIADALQLRGARQRGLHRAGIPEAGVEAAPAAADAAGADAAAAGGGSTSGPFWPQPAAAHASSAIVAPRGAPARCRRIAARRSGFAVIGKF